MNTQSSNTVWHHATVTRQRREALNGHRAAVIWFTGLSGSGSSTLAHAVEEELHQRGCRTFVLDDHKVRHGLGSNLGFSIDDLRENIRVAFDGMIRRLVLIGPSDLPPALWGV